MKKGLALLLAASMTFSAFASAAGAEELTAQEKYDALVEQGIFTGFDDGTARLEESMTRAQVAAIITRLLELEENAAKAAQYPDLAGAEWAAGYIGAVTPTYMEGHASGNFGPSETLTLEQLATVMTRVLDLEVDANASVAGASEWAQGYVAAAIEAGLIEESADYTQPAPREALVVSAYAAQEQIQEEEIATQYNAQAVGARTIEVNLGAAVNPSNVTFEVKKGTTTVNVSEVTFNESNTVATISTSAKLTKGEYTVTARGAASEALTDTFTAEDEKVSDIVIASDKASLDRDKDAEYFAYASLEIQNQYGEDVTKSYVGELQISSSADSVTVDSKGKITFLKDDSTPATARDEFNLNETILFTAVHPKTGTYAQQTFTVSQAARVAQIEVVGLVHADDEVLKVNSTASEFSIQIEALDQYGNEATLAMLNDTASKDVHVLVSNDNIFDVQRDGAGNPQFEEDADDNLILPLAPYDGWTTGDELDNGTATVFFTSTTTGNRASIDIEVIDVSKVDVLSLSVPDLAVAGKDVVIPFEAIDQFGEPITDADDLNATDALTSIKVSGAGLTGDPIKFEFDAKTKGAKLVVDTTTHTVDDVAETVFVTAVTSTGKLAQISFSLQPEAEAEVVTGIEDFENTLAYQSGVGAQFKFKAEDLDVLDQYGEDFEIEDYLGAGQYTVKLTKDAADTEISFLLNGTAVAPAALVLDDASDEITIVANAKGTATFTIELYNNGVLVDGSEKDLRVNVVDRSSITGYEVKDLGKLYVGDGTGLPAGYDETKKVEVSGLLSNGTKVVVPADALNTFFTVTGDVYYDNAGKIASDGGTYGLDANEEKTISLIILGKTKDGTVQVAKDIVVSNKLPEADKFQVKVATAFDANAEKESDGVVSVKYTAFNGVANGSDFISAIADNVVEVKDQYGKVMPAGKFKDVVISGFDKERSTLALVDAANAAAVGDELNVTVIAQNNKIFQFKVLITE